jgi:uncharacterized protein YndB with AHSA1/START domain
MKEYRASTTIKASPEKIWAILTDAAKYPEWDPVADRIADVAVTAELHRRLEAINLSQ